VRDGAASRLRIHVNRLDVCPAAGVPGLEAREAREELAELLERAVRLALRRVGAAGPGELSLTLLPLEEISRLNREYLGREGPTDVISFRLDEEPLIADVYAAPAIALRAAEAGEAESVREELVRLAVHGALHAAGCDHPEDEGRWESPMYRLQEEIVARVADEGAGAP